MVSRRPTAPEQQQQQTASGSLVPPPLILREFPLVITHTLGEAEAVNKHRSAAAERMKTWLCTCQRALKAPGGRFSGT